MAEPRLLTAEELRKLIDYEPDTGLFFWKRVPSREISKDLVLSARWFKRTNRRVGDPALNGNKGGGYLGGHILMRPYLAHRVAWLMTHGDWPVVVDHINHNTGDNRITNLRNVSHQENRRNLSRSKRHIPFGVFRCKKRGTWGAQISVDGKNVSLGSYLTRAEAEAARFAAAKLEGYHENHGK